jgi:hypothetical protein
MVSAVLQKSTLPDHRGGGRISLSRQTYSVRQGTIVFNHDGNKGSGLYCCTLHKAAGGKQLLGAIERNQRTQCWQITHVARLPWVDGISYLSHTEAVDHLIELHSHRSAA